jgi:gentisate 1,2-dioxygenase
MSSTPTDNDRTAKEFYASLDGLDIQPLWKELGTLLPPAPTSKAVPFLWRYDSVRPALLEAGAVISAEEAERRALMLINPGMKEKSAAAADLYAAIQMVLPGEIAPAHRHVAAALRLVIEGSGGYTAVNGERTQMEPGDLVLTPSWAWHDHGNSGEEPVIWLDGLDLPFVNDVEANFFGGGLENPQEEAVPADQSARLHAAGGLVPVREEPWPHLYSPIVNYRWSRVRPVLEDALADGVGSPYDGALFEYANPLTGGPVLPTISCFAQALAAGAHTEAHRHTTSAVYHVVAGSGTTIVDGQEIEWGPKDTFAVPGWAVHEHVNASGEPAFLFSFTDHAVLRPLGLVRGETAERQA